MWSSLDGLFTNTWFKLSPSSLVLVSVPSLICNLYVVEPISISCDHLLIFQSFIHHICPLSLNFSFLTSSSTKWRWLFCIVWQQKMSSVKPIVFTKDEGALPCSIPWRIPIKSWIFLITCLQELPSSCTLSPDGFPALFLKLITPSPSPSYLQNPWGMARFQRSGWKVAFVRPLFKEGLCSYHRTIGPFLSHQSLVTSWKNYW